MNPVKFPEQNNVLAKNQPEFRVLPIFMSDADNRGVRQYTCKYELSELELAQINHTKGFYFSQYGNCFHPILPQIESAFLRCEVWYEVMPTGLYDFGVNMTDGSVLKLIDVPVDKAIETILKHVNNIAAENILFVERPSLGIDEKGNLTNI